jgi:hypothetical protein
MSTTHLKLYDRGNAKTAKGIMVAVMAMAKI